VHVGSALVAHEQALELMQPGEGALDHPAPAPEAGAVLGAAASDHGCDPAPAQLAPVALMVVAAVANDLRWALPRPSGQAPNRGDALDERNELGDVVAVAAGQGARERDPCRIDEEVML